MTTSATILLIDSDDHSAALLLHDLGRQGLWRVEQIRPGLRNYT